MTKRYSKVLLLERWRDEVELDKLFLICRQHKNTHIIVDNSKESTISVSSPGMKQEHCISLIHEAKNWNSTHNNKMTVIMGNYKPWHIELSRSTLSRQVAQDPNYDHRQMAYDEFAFSILHNFWDDIQIWPTYFLAWNGYKIFKHCNYNDKNLGAEIPYTEINKLFCLKIRTPKPHRVLLLDELEKRGLLENNVFSCLGPQDALDESMEFLGAEHYSRGIQTLGQPMENMNPYQQQPPLYEETLIEVVSETYLGSYFYTEKTLWPIVYRKPFLIHGAQYQNHDLQKLGFELYDEYIDYSFDKISDHRQRTAALSAELERLSNLSMDYQQVYNLLLPKINRNLRVMLDIYHNDTHIPAVIKEYGPHIWKNEFLNKDVSHKLMSDPEFALTWQPYFESNGRNQRAVEFIRSWPYLSDLYYRTN